MEEEIMILTESLTSPGQPGLQGGLVDEEDFPRADIDVTRKPLSSYVRFLILCSCPETKE